MNQKIKQIIIVVAVIVVAFVAFKVFFPNSGSDNTSIVADQTNSVNFVDGQSILLLLNKLNRVIIDESVFSNPIFISLVSFERPLANQVSGRPNPFLPIGVDNSSIIFPLSTSTSGTI